MAVEVLVPPDEVDTIRKHLDPMCAKAPTSYTDLDIPNTVFLKYENVENEGRFMAAAMAKGAFSASRV